MATLTANKKVTYTLTMSEAEARFLYANLQNPLGEETTIDYDARTEIWHALKDAGVGVNH